MEGDLSSEKTLPTAVSIYPNMECRGGSVPGPAQRRQQARKSSIPSGEERCREMLSLADTKSTEPRRRDISEAAAVEVPTAVPWITSRMLAESMAEMRYSLMEAGICQGKCHCAGVSLSFDPLCRAGRGLSPLPPLCWACSSPSPGTSSWFSLCPELLEKVNKLQGGIKRPAPIMPKITPTLPGH